MRRIVFCALALFSFIGSSYADITNRLNIATQDGTVSTYPYKAKFSNGTLTDNGDGTVSIASSVIASSVAVNAVYPGAVSAGTYSNITGVGTVGTGVWNGTRLTSAFIPADVAYTDVSNIFTSSQTISGHFISSGTTPSMGACGTNPSVAGTDNAGVITIGSGVTVTSCALNFANAFANPPVCVESDNNTGVTADIASISNSSVTFGFNVSLGGGTLWYVCIGQKG